MARTDRSEFGVAGAGAVQPRQPDSAPQAPPKVGPRRRVSTGHVVMIVAGLLATLLTYSVLRQAGAKGTEVLVAGDDIKAGQKVAATMFTTTEVKASEAALSGMLRAGHEAEIVGQVAVVAVPKGQIVARSQFRPATAPPPTMALQVDAKAIPGGPGSLVAGSRIDIVAATPDGKPYVVRGLEVLKAPEAPNAGQLGASTVSIAVVVPDGVAEQVQVATASGKFMIRVTGPAGAAG